MNESLFARGEKILVACSGGKDSVYLLELVFRERERLGIELGVAHVDHGLRCESAEDARFVRGLAKSRELPYFERRLELATEKARRGVEALAREKRYEALEEIALAEGYASVATAHHRDDQIETVLLRILQGAAPRHWLGMLSHRAMHKSSTVALIRPLLDESCAGIETQRRAWELPHREDPSNSNTRFLRNQIRSRLASLDEDRRREIEDATLALQMQAVRLCALEKRMAQVMLRPRLRAWERTLVIDLENLPLFPEWFLAPIAEGFLRELGGSAPDGTVQAIVKLWQGGRSGAVALDPGGVETRRRKNLLEFAATHRVT